MRLLPEWRRLLRKAWSVRLALIAGVLSGVEVVLPFFADAVPRGVFALLSFVAVCGALVARLVAQKDLQ